MPINFRDRLAFLFDGGRGVGVEQLSGAVLHSVTDNGDGTITIAGVNASNAAVSVTVTRAALGITAAWIVAQINANLGGTDWQGGGGNGGGVTIGQVQAQIRNLVSDFAESGDTTTDVPEGKIPASIARTANLRTDAAVTTLATAAATAVLSGRFVFPAEDGTLRDPTEADYRTRVAWNGSEWLRAKRDIHTGHDKVVAFEDYSAPGFRGIYASSSHVPNPQNEDTFWNSHSKGWEFYSHTGFLSGHWNDYHGPSNWDRYYDNETDAIAGVDANREIVAYRRDNGSYRVARVTSYTAPTTDTYTYSWEPANYSGDLSTDYTLGYDDTHDLGLSAYMRGVIRAAGVSRYHTMGYYFERSYDSADLFAGDPQPIRGLDIHDGNILVISEAPDPKLANQNGEVITVPGLPSGVLVKDVARHGARGFVATNQGILTYDIAADGAWTHAATNPRADVVAIAAPQTDDVIYGLQVDPDVSITLSRGRVLADDTITWATGTTLTLAQINTALPTDEDDLTTTSQIMGMSAKTGELLLYVQQNIDPHMLILAVDEGNDGSFTINADESHMAGWLPRIYGATRTGDHEIVASEYTVHLFKEGDPPPGLPDWVNDDVSVKIPDGKISDAITRDTELDAVRAMIRTDAQIDARVTAGVSDWAEEGNNDPIPVGKLSNAPGGDPLTRQNDLFNTGQITDLKLGRDDDEVAYRRVPASRTTFYIRARDIEGTTEIGWSHTAAANEYGRIRPARPAQIRRVSYNPTIQRNSVYVTAGGSLAALAVAANPGIDVVFRIRGQTATRRVTMASSVTHGTDFVEFITPSGDNTSTSFPFVAGEEYDIVQVQAVTGGQPLNVMDVAYLERFATKTEEEDERDEIEDGLRDERDMLESELRGEIAGLPTLDTDFRDFVFKAAEQYPVDATMGARRSAGQTEYGWQAFGAGAFGVAPAGHPPRVQAILYDSDEHKIYVASTSDRYRNRYLRVQGKIYHMTETSGAYPSPDNHYWTRTAELDSADRPTNLPGAGNDTRQWAVNIQDVDSSSDLGPLGSTGVAISWRWSARDEFPDDASGPGVGDPISVTLSGNEITALYDNTDSSDTALTGVSGRTSWANTFDLNLGQELTADDEGSDLRVRFSYNQATNHRSVDFSVSVKEFRTWTEFTTATGTDGVPVGNAKFHISRGTSDAINLLRVWNRQGMAFRRGDSGGNHVLGIVIPAGDDNNDYQAISNFRAIVELVPNIDQLSVEVTGTTFSSSADWALSGNTDPIPANKVPKPDHFHGVLDDTDASGHAWAAVLTSPTPLSQGVVATTFNTSRTGFTFTNAGVYRIDAKVDSYLSRAIILRKHTSLPTTSSQEASLGTQEVFTGRDAGSIIHNLLLEFDAGDVIWFIDDDDSGDPGNLSVSIVKLN